MSLPALALNEPIIHALVALFEARLPTVVEGLNATVTDGITLDPPVQILKFKPVAGTLKAGLPVVCVQDLPMRTEDDLQSSMTAVHGLGIAPYLANADQEALAWQLRRYIQAIAYTIQQDRQEGFQGYLARIGGVWHTRFVGTEPGPLLADHNPGEEGAAPSSFESWSWLMIECKRTEV